MRHLVALMGPLFAAAAKAETASDAGAAAAPEAEKPEWTPLGDMSLKKIGAVALDAVRQNVAVFMGRVFGEATDAKQKEGKGGDIYTYLIGDFRAINGKGEKFESTKLFLPGRMMEEIESILKSTGAPVEFGFDIFSTPDASSSTGYKYAAKQLVKTEANDRVNKLAGSLIGKPLPK